MKNFTLTIAIVLIQLLLFAQCPEDGIYFNTQEQIDNFQINHPNCSEIEGSVTISGSDITNLNGLSVLTSIGGDLRITGNDSLTSLAGLDNLTSIGNDLIIGDGSQGGNYSLTQLSGLEGLQSISGDLNIVTNESLQDLTGLNNLTSINGNFTISCNESLLSLNGINNLKSINGDMDVIHTQIENFEGLNNLNFVGGDFYVHDNTALTNFQGLETLTSIEGSLFIGIYMMGAFGNPALISLTGLENISMIGEYLAIINNDVLTDLSGLEGLASVGNGLTITENETLISLTDLSGLTFVGNQLEIIWNPSLASLNGLENIDGFSISDLYIYGNTLLSTCEVQSVCDYLITPNGSVEIFDNATGCNSQQEVEEACESVSIAELNTLQYVSIFPNPTHSTITTELPTKPSKYTSLTISNTSGQQLITQSINKPQTEIDISYLPVGIYIVKVWDEKDVMVKKIIKQ